MCAVQLWTIHKKSKQKAPKPSLITVWMWDRAQTWREDGYTLLVTLWPMQREFHSVSRITAPCLSGQEVPIDRPFPFLMSKLLWSYYRKMQEAEAPYSQSSLLTLAWWTRIFTHFLFPELVTSQTCLSFSSDEGLAVS